MAPSTIVKIEVMKGPPSLSLLDQQPASALTLRATSGPQATAVVDLTRANAGSHSTLHPSTSTLHTRLKQLYPGISNSNSSSSDPRVRHVRELTRIVFARCARENECCSTGQGMQRGRSHIWSARGGPGLLLASSAERKHYGGADISGGPPRAADTRAGLSLQGAHSVR